MKPFSTNISHGVNLWSFVKDPDLKSSINAHMHKADLSKSSVYTKNTPFKTDTLTAKISSQALVAYVCTVIYVINIAAYRYK